MAEFKVTRRGKGTKFAMEEGTAVELSQIDDPWMSIEVMAQSDLLEALFYHLEPGATSGDLTDHDGQEVHMVVSGEVQFRVGKERVTLGPGDVMWHRSEVPHRVKNLSEEDAVVFLVNLPPIFKW